MTIFVVAYSIFRHRGLEHFLYFFSSLKLHHAVAKLNNYRVPSIINVTFLDDEDDGEHQRPVRKAPAIVKPPPNNTRLPANMDNPRPNNNRPRIAAHPLQAPPPVWGGSTMAPPITPNSHKIVGGLAARPLPMSSAAARGTPPVNFSATAGGYSSAGTDSSPQLSTSRLLNRSRAQSNLSLNLEVRVKCYYKLSIIMLSELSCETTG